MGLTREERKLMHQKSVKPTFSDGIPNNRDGFEGDITFRKVPGSGTVEYVKENGEWKAIASSGEMPSIRIAGAGSSSSSGGGGGTMDHSSLANLTVDTHLQYLLHDGTRELTANWDAGSFLVQSDDIQADTSLSSLGTLDVDGATTLDQVTIDTADGVFSVDGTNGTTINSTAGSLSIGNDADDFSIYIGTAGERAIQIGNSSAQTTSAVEVYAAQGGITFDTVAHPTADTGNIIFETGDANATNSGHIVFHPGQAPLGTPGNIAFDAEGGQIQIGKNTAAGDIYIGTNATARDIFIGNDTGATALDFDAGTGGVTIDSQGAGTIAIGTETDTGAINIGVGASARTITAGNAASTAVNINALAIALTSVNTLDLSDGTATFQLGGTGATSLSGGTTTDIDGSGALSLNSTAGDINIGDDDDDFNINIGTQGERQIDIGTGAFADDVRIGNVTGASSVAIKSGTGHIDLASTGVGNITIDSGNEITLDAGDILELNSAGGEISIGNDDIDENINIGTQGERTVNIATGAFADVINIGNVTGATNVNIDSGTGGVDVSSTGAGDITLDSSNDIILSADDDTITMDDGTTTRFTFNVDVGNLEITSGSSGDPTITFDINASDRFTMGVDDSDSDKFKIDSGSSLTTTSDFELDSAGNGTFKGDLEVSGQNITMGTYAQELNANLTERLEIQNTDFGVHINDPYAYADAPIGTEHYYDSWNVRTQLGDYDGDPLSQHLAGGYADFYNNYFIAGCFVESHGTDCGINVAKSFYPEAP